MNAEPVTLSGAAYFKTVCALVHLLELVETRMPELMTARDRSAHVTARGFIRQALRVERDVKHGLCDPRGMFAATTMALTGLVGGMTTEDAIRCLVDELDPSRADRRALHQPASAAAS